MINSDDDIRYCQDVFGVYLMLPTLLEGELRHSLTNTGQLMTITLCVNHVFDVDYKLIAAID